MYSLDSFFSQLIFKSLIFVIFNFEQSSLQKRDIYKKRKKLILNNKSKNLLSYTALIRS